MHKVDLKSEPTFKITDQEVYDISVTHLRQQGCRAADESGCRYRLEPVVADGPMLKCAVGPHIRDEDYTDNFEGYALGFQLDGQPYAGVTEYLLDKGYSDHQLRLLMALQNVHDTIPDRKLRPILEIWEPQFAEIAADFNLQYTQPLPL